MNFGFGAQAFADYYVTDNISVGAEVGFVSHSGEQTIPATFFTPEQTIEFNTNIIPVQATAMYHIDPYEELDFFAGPGFGLFLLGGDFSSTTEFGISPRIGASYEIADEIRLNGQVVYNSVFNSGGNLNYLNIALGATYTLFD
ncbi:MAG: outer membrane beta-barrel protein [Owenweeksia sp.]|nr:outer membrane beta-barrel protein [Owenweeksia sp.]